MRRKYGTVWTCVVRDRQTPDRCFTERDAELLVSRRLSTPGTRPLYHISARCRPRSIRKAIVDIRLCPRSGDVIHKPEVRVRYVSRRRQTRTEPRPQAANKQRKSGKVWTREQRKTDRHQAVALRFPLGGRRKQMTHRGRCS